eukprot:ANDGO_01682.mRNA.1 hypothetical protein (macronuclear)
MRGDSQSSAMSSPLLNDADYIRSPKSGDVETPAEAAWYDGQRPQQRVHDLHQRRQSVAASDPSALKCSGAAAAPNPVSIADAYVSFHSGIFIREFLYNFLIPFAIPVIYVFEGWYSLMNRLLWVSSRVPGSAIFFTQQLAFFGLLIACDTLYFYNTTNKKTGKVEYSESTVSFIEIVIVNLLYLIRVATIACKYAYQPRSFWKRFNSGLLSANDAQDLLLAVGWFQLRPQLMIRQLYFTEARTGIDLSSSYLVFRSDTQNLAVVSQVSPEQQIAIDNELLRVPYEKKRLHAREVAWLCLAAAASRVNVSRIRVAAMTVTVIHSFLPCLFRLITYGTFFGENRFDISVVVIGIVLSLFFMYVDVLFLACSAVDMYRRAKSLGHLTTVTNHIAQDASPMNWRVWIAIRRILVDFGRQYLSRLCWFLGMFLVFLFILLLYMVITLYNATDLSQIDSIAIGIVAFDSLVFSIIMMVVVVNGASANQMCIAHQSKLRSIQLELASGGGIDNEMHQHEIDAVEPELRKTTGSFKDMSRSSAFESADKRDLDLECIRAIEALCQAVSTEQELNPISILGIQAGYPFARFLMTAVGGIFAASIQQYIRLIRQDSSSNTAKTD